MADEARRQQALAIIEEALVVARKATPELQRLELMQSIGSTLAAVDPERAFALIEEARQAFRRSLGLDDPQQPNDPRAEARRIMSRLKAAGSHYASWYVRQILTAPDPQDALAGARGAADSSCDRGVFEKWAETAARAFPERAADFYRRAEHADWSMANTVRVLARSDPQRALTLARQIPRRWNRVVALCEVADALADRDPAAADPVVREALAEARADERDDYRPWLLDRLVFTLRRVNPEAALEIARESPDVSQRARAITAVAYAFRHRDPPRAPEVFEQALAATRQVQEEWARWLESDLVEGWAELDPVRALAVARGIGASGARVIALAKLLPALAQRDPDLACEAGDELLVAGREQLDPWLWGEGPTWWELAFPVLARLDPQRYLRLAVQTRDKDARRPLIYQVMRQVALLDADRAQALAAELARAEDRSWALGAIADALAETDPSRAREVAERLTDERDRHAALISIVRTMTARDPHAALRYLDELQNEIVSLNTLQGIADALAESDPPTAASLIWQMLETYEREHREGEYTGEVLEHKQWSLLWTLVKADPAEAVRLARKVRRGPVRVQMMLQLADRLLGIPEWSEEDFTEQEPLL